jgi:hypothetical protein
MIGAGVSGVAAVGIVVGLGFGGLDAVAGEILQRPDGRLVPLLEVSGLCR